MIKLKATRKDYSFTSESGYSFQVTAVLDDEWGWEASVSMSTQGSKECDGAVKHLAHACRAFLAMLESDEVPR